MRKRKKKKEDDDAQGGDIRVMMVSLNLILLVFFVYINTIGINDPSRVKRALDSLIGTFTLLPDGLSISSGKELSIPGPPILTSRHESFNLAGRLREIIAQEKKEKEVTLAIEGDDLVVNMADIILFPSGSAELHDESLGLLRKIAILLKQSSHPVRIEGHTDNQPISTARYPSNWELSASRALNVLRYLAEKMEIPQERLTAVGFGEYRPLVSNDTEEHRARNRRVTIVLIGGAEKDERKR